MGYRLGMRAVPMGSASAELKDVSITIKASDAAVQKRIRGRMGGPDRKNLGLSWQGLFRLEPETGKVERFLATASCSRAGETEERLWVGTQEGLCDFDPIAGTLPFRISAGEGENRTLGGGLPSLHSTGWQWKNLWVGGDPGLNRADANAGTIRISSLPGRRNRRPSQSLRLCDP